jgi:hypothetical protein
MPGEPNLPVRLADPADPGPPSEAFWTPYPGVSKAYAVDMPAIRGIESEADLPEGSRGWAWETPDPPDKVRAWAQQHLLGWSIKQTGGDNGQPYDDMTPPSGPANACIFRPRGTDVTYLVLMLIPEPSEDAAASDDDTGGVPGRASDAAKRTTCISSAHQLAIAMTMYSLDYDQVFPGADWPTALQPYLRDSKVLLCPSDDQLPSYALRPPLRGAPSTTMTPAEDIMLYESDDDRTLVARHKGETVLSYVDGHTKAMPKSSVTLQPGMR